ncbi:MAG: histidinol phosphate phosphatase domain-containing protein [Candidatus Adiutrix sp.]|jgi:histidinol phosphatase-like PHP family hydrolase|nr:histidinol phosphate phosphatase domain-containing protein [Candidatus Adiutrix sp.]
MNEAAVIDFHTHSFLSDGELVPAELARRCLVSGYSVLGMADHVDHGTLPDVLRQLRAAASALNGHMDGLCLLPGVEITHVPPALIGDLVKQARDLGASHVVVHGETPVEPVAPGTNRAAIEAGADILAHPGILSEKDAELAAEKGVHVELSGRGGHSLGNGLVAALARRYGFKLVINSDGHAPGDYLTPARRRLIALGAGLSEEEYAAVLADAARLADVFKKRL